MHKRRPWTSPSEMRTPVIVEDATKTEATSGEKTISSWNPFPLDGNGERFISVLGLGGSEVIEAGRQGMVITHQIRMRYLEGLTSDMRFKFPGTERVLYIVSIVDWMEQKREHRCLCREAVA